MPNRQFYIGVASSLIGITLLVVVLFTYAWQEIKVLTDEINSIETEIILYQTTVLVAEEDQRRGYDVIEMKVTAYAPFDNKSGICADENPSSTSTGTFPQHGTIAVDPVKLPYGTEMYIPHYGYGTAEDTGAFARNYSEYAIDVYVDTYEEAMAWGVQYLDVIIFH